MPLLVLSTLKEKGADFDSPNMLNSSVTICRKKNQTKSKHHTIVGSIDPKLLAVINPMFIELYHS